MTFSTHIGPRRIKCRANLALREKGTKRQEIGTVLVINRAHDGKTGIGLFISSALPGFCFKLQLLDERGLIAENNERLGIWQKENHVSHQFLDVPFAIAFAMQFS